MLYKKYIPVVSLIGKGGEITPISIIWEDYKGSTTYRIDKILDIRKSRSELGFMAIRYECVVGGKKRHLYYENTRWFIESYRPY